jgi:hypothetical protein
MFARHAVQVGGPRTKLRGSRREVRSVGARLRAVRFVSSAAVGAHVGWTGQRGVVTSHDELG